MTEIPRQKIDVDIACVGFGPATGGFLKTLSDHLVNPDGTPKLESRVVPGLPLQVVCYERADDIGFGVSGVVSKADSIRSSLADVQPQDIPMCAEVTEERLLYLLDPVGASRRTIGVRLLDKVLRALRWLPLYREHAFRMPFTPGFINKHGGWVFSIGQFSQWLGMNLMSTGLIQLWPGTPVSEPLIENEQVRGIRLMDQGTDLQGKPVDGFMPGMDIQADLTVVGDGPVGTVGLALDEQFGLPHGNERKDWAVGAKMVVELPEDTPLKAGTVFHTLGYPEPEIFGFFYVHPDRLASVGIFVPSWFDNPVRSTYRYLQHWILHPYLYKYLKGATMRSWGAKSLQESGRRGEPFLVGEGWARIGEGSGSTNIFTNSGVDEAWHTGKLLAESVVELLSLGKPMDKANLTSTYIERRRKSTLEKETKMAEHSRDGFQKGLIPGLIGMMLTAVSGGRVRLPIKTQSTQERLERMQDFYRKRLSEQEWEEIRQKSASQGVAMNDLVMTRMGWPEIPYDGQLLISHQDALLVGGKVQAPGGYRDHVAFIYPHLCEACDTKLCIEICSGQAITPGENGIPAFDREKCIHCGACLWNCTRLIEASSSQTNVKFSAGTGGLHSGEN
ncbi:4Fe-4S ferredoxin [candidate division KSB1 bacterium]|nr:4Fe-4S ferredoxin [candidate division KSB1 bacterium]